MNIFCQPILKIEQIKKDQSMQYAQPWTNFSLQDKPWAEFSTLEVAACIILCTYGLV